MTITRMLPNEADAEPMQAMNMTPLIDVMLVLIIMFILTIPLQLHKVSLDLPSGPSVTPAAEVVDLVIDFDGSTYWNNVLVDHATLADKLGQVAAKPEQAEVHLRANKLAKYKYVASVMATAQQLGVSKIGMVGNEQFI
jgi:biopolymer transport protein ExbD